MIFIEFTKSCDGLRGEAMFPFYFHSRYQADSGLLSCRWSAAVGRYCLSVGLSVCWSRCEPCKNGCTDRDAA